MKSSLLKLALAAVVLCAPVAVHAQTDTTNPIATSPVKNPSADKSAKKAKSKSDKIQYVGTIKSIDASSVVVTTKKGDLTLAISDKTEIKNDKKKAAATDLTVGEKVTGSYMNKADGSMCACSLRGHSK